MAKDRGWRGGKENSAWGLPYLYRKVVYEVSSYFIGVQKCSCHKLCVKTMTVDPFENFP